MSTTDLSKREAREIVEELLFELGSFLDRGRPEEAIALFTDVLAFELGEMRLDRNGLAAHLARRKGAPFASRHMFGNTRIVAFGCDAIDAVVIGLTLKIERREHASSCTVLPADWRVSVQRTGERWRFKSIAVMPAEPPTTIATPADLHQTPRAQQ